MKRINLQRKSTIKHVLFFSFNFYIGISFFKSRLQKCFNPKQVNKKITKIEKNKNLLYREVEKVFIKRSSYGERTE